jgi:acyl-coenzyme A thioesterase PaaI-like protein
MTFPEGYKTDSGFDPAEDHIGPFYYRKEDGGWIYAFRAEDKHCNAHNIVHGGVLMTFADYALCMEASDQYQGDETCITVTFNSEFVAAAELGQVITCNVGVTRKTGSMAFLTGEVRAGDAVVMTFSSVVKRLFENK